jgi:4-amino-4-deoxy-L-arabinose transferase-like glycosyltransferase
MNTNLPSSILLRPSHWFLLFIIVHLLAWTAIPFLVRDNLPLDAIEGALWGHQLEWGYDKNPYLNAWLTTLAIYLGGGSGWMVYLFSQLSVISCLWAVWQLSKQFFSPWYALIAVLMLESMQYFNFHVIDFNDNTLELGLWAVSIYFFYQATRYPNRILYWILTGLFTGFAMMAKYYTASLMVSMCLFLLFDKKHRQVFFTWRPYLALLSFLIVTLPHFIWLFTHDFITVHYIFERTDSIRHWSNHFFFPAQFAIQQLEVFLPAFLIYLCLFLGKRPVVYLNLNLNKEKINNINFIYFLGLGPLLLTLLLSFLFGIKLHAGWGTPILSLSTLILFALAKPRLSPIKIKVFLSGIFTLMGVLLFGYIYSLAYDSNTSSANFPGKMIAKSLTSYWHESYHTHLSYIAGSRWVGGNISFYSPDHPAVFIEWDKKRAPWISIHDMEKKGAIFVWDLTNNKETLPSNVIKAYPQLKKPAIIWEFPWYRHFNGLKPVKIGVSILPPRQQVGAKT